MMDKKSLQIVWVVLAVVAIAVVGFVGYGLVQSNQSIADTNREIARTNEQIAEDERTAAYDECRRGVIAEEGDPEFQSGLRRSLTRTRIRRACGSLFDLP